MGPREESNRKVREEESVHSQKKELRGNEEEHEIFIVADTEMTMDMEEHNPDAS